MRTSDDVTRERLASADQFEVFRALKEWRDQLPRVCLVASARVSRADTSPKSLFVIPSGHEAHLLVLHSDTGSDAGGTAVIDIGKLTPPVALFVAGHSVLGAAGVGQNFPPALRMGLPTPADIPVGARYTETGSASSVGGPWTVTVLYSRVGN